MTQPEHPSAERISELLAGVLPASEAMDVNAHLTSCEPCRDERTALLDLSRLLAAEGGASDLEMPSDVAASIDEAIRHAAAERAVGVVPTDRGRRPAGRQSWRWLAGAAAAVVVVGVGVAGLRALPQQNSDTASADRAGRAAHPPSQVDGMAPAPTLGGESAIPPGTEISGSGSGFDFSSLHPAQVRVRARMLASAPRNVTAPASEGCATPVAGGPSTVVRFKGHLAVLAITPDTRLATIYDCATATKTLFLTGY